MTILNAQTQEANRPMADTAETGKREQELVNVIDAIEEAVSPSNSSPQKKLNNKSMRSIILSNRQMKLLWFRKVLGRR